MEEDWEVVLVSDEDRLEPVVVGVVVELLPPGSRKTNTPFRLLSYS